jgi:ABC-type Zn2+ transport system substrate-binding protein/surface adhesin
VPTACRFVDDNPHLWMDPQFARAYVRKIRDALVAADPPNAPTYRRNAAAYDAQLAALVARTRAQDRDDPAGAAHDDHLSQRVLVLQRAVRFANRRRRRDPPGRRAQPAAYRRDRQPGAPITCARYSAEPEYSPKLVEALAQSAGFRTIDNLYDDSVGTDPKVSTYIGMIDYDTDTIVNALK